MSRNVDYSSEIVALSLHCDYVERNFQLQNKTSRSVSARMTSSVFTDTHCRAWVTKRKWVKSLRDSVSWPNWKKNTWCHFLPYKWWCGNKITTGVLFTAAIPSKTNTYLSPTSEASVTVQENTLTTNVSSKSTSSVHQFISSLQGLTMPQYFTGKFQKHALLASLNNLHN